MNEYPKLAEWIEMDGYIRILTIQNEDGDSGFTRVYPEVEDGDKLSMETLVKAYRDRYPEAESDEPLG